jgi:hypothetical protein
MSRPFSEAIGDPYEFIAEFPRLASEFPTLSGVQYYQLADIRKFVELRNYQISDNRDLSRIILAAFAFILTNQFAQKLGVRGIFRKKVAVYSDRFECDFIDLFYRCVFEGLELSSTTDD